MQHFTMQTEGKTIEAIEVEGKNVRGIQPMLMRTYMGEDSLKFLSERQNARIQSNSVVMRFCNSK